MLKRFGFERRNIIILLTLTQCQNLLLNKL